MRTGTDQAWHQAIAGGARLRTLAFPVGCHITGPVSFVTAMPATIGTAQFHRPREQST
jgi:hypothetical protein